MSLTQKELFIMKKKILALDQAMQKTGWAVFQGKSLIASGTFSIKPTLPIDQRLTSIMQHLSELYNEYEFSKVVYEDIQLQCGNVTTYQRLAYVQAAILIWCYSNDVRNECLAPSHWRKVLKDNFGVAFGKKREDQKQAAIDFVKQQFKIEVNTDEADGICIGFASQVERPTEASTESAF